jgi:ribonuclease P protein component
MNQKYPKSERLKGKNTIDLLFSKGKSVSKYPLRLVYVLLDNETKSDIQVGVSVSKKYFKKAVDRNYFKRVLRETYRLNKHLIVESVNDSYALMFFYQSADRLSYAEIHEKTILLFEKFKAQIKSEKEN